MKEETVLAADINVSQNVVGNAPDEVDDGIMDQVIRINKPVRPLSSEVQPILSALQYAVTFP